MSNDQDMYEVWFRENNLDELDREVERLATICRIRILDRGIVERVRHSDELVCGADNPQVLAKLRNLLMTHFLNRQKISERLGQRHTADLESHVIERLRRASPRWERIGRQREPRQAHART